MSEERLGLPRYVGEGLLLRWSTPADADELVDFNFRHHNDNPYGQPELWLKNWTRELMSGEHPTTGPGDFTVVVDEAKSNRIVSAATLISQTWSYDGIQFNCGRPELVATEETYRRRGLVRAQFETIHALSKSRGELVQAITGIPWYYRQFGYEMALDLGGTRTLPYTKVKDLVEGEEETFHLRLATVEDIPVLARLYETQSASSLVRCIRDEKIWRYEVNNAQRTAVPLRDRKMIETRDGAGVGYVEIYGFPNHDGIRDLSVYESHSMRDVCLFLARTLKAQINGDNGAAEKPSSGIIFRLGREHPVYDALGEELTEPKPPYAWFIRVADLRSFLHHVRPTLESKLAGSVMAGYDGSLRLNFYKRQLAMRFKKGKIADVGAYKPRDFFDGDAYFPGLTFLQLLFGYRSLDELKYAFADCFTTKTDEAVLLKILFPRRSSHVVMLS